MSGDTINMFQIDRYLIILHQSPHLFPDPFIILFRQAANDESLPDFSHHIITVSYTHLDVYKRQH